MSWTFWTSLLHQLQMCICFVLQHQLAERMNTRNNEGRMNCLCAICLCVLCCVLRAHSPLLNKIDHSRSNIFARCVSLSLCLQLLSIMLTSSMSTFTNTSILYLFFVYLRSLSHQKSSIQSSTNGERESEEKNVWMQSRLAFNILFNEHRCLVYGIK